MGCFLALIHFVWSVVVALIPAQLQAFMDWVFALHSLQPVLVITPFNAVNAVILIVMTFIYGYILGVVAMWIWERSGKCCRKKKK